MNPTEQHYKLLTALEQNPEASQRELAAELGISLGKVNYCLKALVQVGWIKVGNFTHSNNKLGYLYLLTPKGIEEKSALTKHFLQRKIEEFERLQKEIAQLKDQIEN